MLYSQKPNSLLIGDEISGKKYLFQDDFLPIKYEMKNESKIVDDIKLKKAEAQFRGRKYIIWYDPSSKIKGGPWKFTDLPGIAYEIHDDKNLFRWSLVRIEKLDSKIENPFIDYKGAKLPYTEYPKLKYISPVFFSDGVKKESKTVMIEQNRDGLEKTFEWEK